MFGKVKGSKKVTYVAIYLQIPRCVTKVLGINKSI